MLKINRFNMWCADGFATSLLILKLLLLGLPKKKKKRSQTNAKPWSLKFVLQNCL